MLRSMVSYIFALTVLCIVTGVLGPTCTNAYGSHYRTATAGNNNQQSVAVSSPPTLLLATADTVDVHSLQATTKKPPVIITFGDSITAGYGLPDGTAWPDVLGNLLAEQNLPVTIINAGVSGDTSAGGKARIGWSLGDKPDLLILALGANDALRGLPAKQLYSNLASIIEACRKANVTVLLAGMYAPKNMGPEYGKAFNEVYPALASAYNTPLYPFLLEGVALNPALNLNDGIHPNEKGARIIAKGMLPLVKKLLQNAAP